MADVKIPEFQIPTITTLADDDFFRVVTASGLSRSIQKSIVLNEYVTDDELNTALVNYFTKAEINNMLGNFYTKTEIDNTFNDYYTSVQVDDLLKNYYTKTEVDTLLGGKENVLNNPTTDNYILYSLADGTRSWKNNNNMLDGTGVNPKYLGTTGDMNDIYNTGHFIGKPTGSHPSTQYIWINNFVYGALDNPAGKYQTAIDYNVINNPGFWYRTFHTDLGWGAWNKLETVVATIEYNGDLTSAPDLASLQALIPNPIPNKKYTIKDTANHKFIVIYEDNKYYYTLLNEAV